MTENKSSISKARTLEETGAFWDEHDFTEFDTDAPDVIFNISSYVSIVSIELELLLAVEEQANKRGVALEALVNLWLKEKLLEVAPKP